VQEAIVEVQKAIAQSWSYLLFRCVTRLNIAFFHPSLAFYTLLKKENI